MATAQHNADTIRAGYAAFAAGDMPTVASLLAPDISWHMSGRSPLAGTYQGTDAVFGYLAQLMKLTEGTYQVHVRDVLASEEHVVALVRETGRRSSKSLDANEAHIWRMVDGRAAEFWAYREDGEPVDDFWS